MIDLLSLAKSSSAYRTLLSDKQNNRLSHAYLIVCPDENNLCEYLKIFAKLIVCNENGCNECRACSLIEQGVHSDVAFYPKEGDSVLTSDINSIVSESYIKPIESDKKLFVINNGQTMNASSQNKLLKTLEEPPKNVTILIGATVEYPLLPTVLSRVRKISFAPFSEQALFDALKTDCSDTYKLKSAIACGDGTVGRAYALYKDDNLSKAMELGRLVLTEMRSSKDVLEYSVKIGESKIEFLQLVSVLEVYIRDMLVCLCDSSDLAFDKVFARKTINERGFTKGAVIAVSEDLLQARQRKKFNANQSILTEWLLFKILEDKYKWQK